MRGLNVVDYDYIEQGDCLELMKKIPDGSVDLVLTDCPYHIVSGGCTNKGKGNGIFQRENASNGKLFDHNDIAFAEWLPQVFRILKSDSHCYIMINGRNLKELWQTAEQAGFSFQNLLVWEKGNVTPNRYYMNACEFILMLRKGKAKTIKNAGTSSLLKVKNQVGRKYHPTEKPIPLMELLIENSSDANGIVCDPFMGSGSTCIAAVNTNRHYIGFELDPQYFQIARGRLEEAKNRR
jgi:site-specific DNA-methyltransferase (adenine-specific)